MDVFKGLNKAQEEAVRATEGPLLILAGAGSGKTKVIAHRISHIIQKGTPPERILAVTFTNKAAEEMRERVKRLLLTASAGNESAFGRQYPFISTFHSLGVFILKNHGSMIGIPRTFTILDETDSLKIVKELVEETELDPEIYAPERLHNAISRLKNELIDPSLFNKEAQNPYEKILSRIYTAYEARMMKSKSLDFDDLLLKPVLLLESFPDILKHWQDYWHYIHIDEYQDTNQAQYKLSLMLANLHKNIAVVGDINQAIYSWRGADWRNILNFEHDFKNSRVIYLEENYRSTKIILEAASAVITNNRERKNITLRTQNQEGETITISVLENEKEEAKTIASQIASLLKEGYKYHDIAILFRTNAQSRALEEALIKSAIPYKLVAGVKFYERKEIKDVLSYLKYSANSHDLLSLKRILNTPPRGIGKALAVKYLGGNGASLTQLTIQEKRKIGAFETIIKKIREGMKTKKIHSLLKQVIGWAEFERYLSQTKDGAERLKNIQELLSVAKKFDDLDPQESFETFLEEISLMSDQDFIDEKSEKIHLMTAHAAKGLEFSVVIIAGLEEGLFPHILAQEDGLLEEERRLFYVALTRAQNRIFITLTRRRMLYGELTFNDPSRFIKEIPKHLLTNGEAMGETIDYEN